MEDGPAIPPFSWSHDAGIGAAMHDIRLIRDDPDAFDAGLARRGAEPVAKAILALDEERRALTTQLQAMQSRRNEASKAIGAAMGKGETETAEALKAEVAQIKADMPKVEEREKELGEDLQGALAIIPNIPFEDVPEGEDEDGNVEVSSWGEKPAFDFEPKEHADIAPALGMDFETGALLSGAVREGVNQVSPPVFEHSQYAQLERKALDLAAKDARARAETRARSLDVTLGDPVSIAEQGLPQLSPQPEMFMRANAVQADSAAGYETGQISLEARLVVVFALR